MKTILLSILIGAATVAAGHEALVRVDNGDVVCVKPTGLKPGGGTWPAPVWSKAERSGKFYTVKKIADPDLNAVLGNPLSPANSITNSYTAEKRPVIVWPYAVYEVDIVITNKPGNVETNMMLKRPSEYRIKPKAVDTIPLTKGTLNFYKITP